MVAVPELQTLAQFTLNGLALGAIIALSAVGLTLVYGILNLSNFSHGDLLTAGAYAALFFLAMGTIAEAATYATALAILLVLAALADRYSTRLLSTTERGIAIGAAGVLLGLAAGVRDEAVAPTAVRYGVPLLLAGLVLLAARARPGERIPILLGGSAAVATATAWLWATPLTLAIALAMAAVAALSAALELALWRPLRRGALAPASHILLGGFVGLVVGMIATTGLLEGTARTLALAATAVAGSLASWRLLGDRPIARANLVTYLIASIGVAFAIRYALVLQFGAALQAFPLPTARAEPVFGLLVPDYQRITFIVVLVTLALLHPLLAYTKFGKAVRALADNLELARVTGIRVDRVVLYVWLLAGALTALAGVLLALNVGTFHAELGWGYLLLMFSAVILGGIGSVYGSLAGGFVIGVATELSVLLLDSKYKFAVAFVVLIAILLVRPQGVFGVKP